MSISSWLLAVPALVAGAAAAAQTPGDTRDQVAAAFAALSGMKVSVATAYAVSARLPGNYQEAGMTGPVETLHATLSLGAEGIITVAFNDKADAVLRGKIAKIVPMRSASTLYFYCLAPALPAELRPTGCLAEPVSR